MKHLDAIFPAPADQARARKILAGNYEAVLGISPAARQWHDACYSRPSLWEVKMRALDSLADGHGVHGVELEPGRWATFVDMGDPYITTIVHYDGQFLVGDWGTILEEHGR